MKLATYPNGSRDGRLMVVSRDLKSASPADSITPSLRSALEQWSDLRLPLLELYDRLNDGSIENAVVFEPELAMAPLPCSAQWLDGSAFPSHGKRMTKAFQLSDAPSKSSAPLMYQGCPDFLGACADVILPREADGIDFEAELAVITGQVAMGSDPALCEAAIYLLMLVDDVSLRALQPGEMGLGFGMIHSKPASVCSPVCVTPDELGDAWRDGKASLSMTARLNGKQVGRLSGDEMQYTFGELIAHAVFTRSIGPATVLGSGTFSNEDPTAGVGCIAERRASEKNDTGTISSGWLRFGDRVQIEMLDAAGKSVFGMIDHGYKMQVSQG